MTFDEEKVQLDYRILEYPHNMLMRNILNEINLEHPKKENIHFKVIAINHESIDFIYLRNYRLKNVLNKF